MNKIKYSNIIIIGSGPSGCTCSIYLSRANFNPILITGNKAGGQLLNTYDIENWPGENNISGFDLMDKIFIQLKKLNLEFYYDFSYKLNLLSKPILLFGYINFYICDILIISTGSLSRHLCINNEYKYIGKNISTCCICDGNFYKNKNIFIIGGGNVALESAIYLSNLVNKIILLNRSKKFICEYILFRKFLLKKIFNNNVIVKLNSIILEIIGDDEFFKYLKILNLINNKINYVYSDGLFISIGNIPNSYMFIGQLKLFNNYILNYSSFNNNFSLTSLNGIFSSGDIHDYVYKQAITSSSYGCISSFDSIYYYNKLISII